MRTWLLLLAALCAPGTLALGQSLPNDDGVLYFPPKLTVHATATDNPAAKSQADNEHTIALRIRENAQTDFLLPILFFEGSGSVTIPERYQTFFSAMETDGYTDSSDMLEQPTQNDNPKYLQLLNILGYRMAALPGSRVELEGGYSWLPGETPEVGSTRAEVVRDYLTTIWHIEPERVTLSGPRRICDSSANLLRQEEAQRVVIIPSTPQLIAPVNYFLVRMRESLIAFNIAVDPSMAPEDVAGIELVISMGDQIVSSTQIPGNPDSTIYNLWGMWPAFQLQTTENSQLVVQTFIRTVHGTVRPSNAVRLAINKVSRRPRQYERVDPFHTDKFFLPFFDWRDSSLSGLQHYYLDEFSRTFRTNAEERAGQPYTLSVTAAGELSENTLPDEARIATLRATYTLRNNTFKTLFAPQSKFTVVFFGEESEVEPMVFVREWLGEEYIRQLEKLEQAQQSDDYAESDSERAYMTFDSTAEQMILGRGRRVAQYLQEQIGADLHASIAINDEVYSPYTYELFPEERYYARRVTFYLQPFYEWNEEENSLYNEYEEEEEYVPEVEYQEYEEYEEHQQETPEEYEEGEYTEPE